MEKVKYKELIFREDEDIVGEYEISVKEKDGERTIGHLSMDPNSSFEYNLALTHVSKGSIEIFATNHPNLSKIFNDDSILETIRLALMSVENYRRNSNWDDVWLYENFGRNKNGK